MESTEKPDLTQYALKLASSLTNQARYQLLAPALVALRLARIGLNGAQRRTIYAFAVLCLIFLYVTSTLLGLVLSHGNPMLDTGRALVCFICTCAIVIVNTLFNNLFADNVSNLMSNAASTEALRALENWFHGFLSLRRQVAFSVFLSIMIVPTLLVIQHATSARFSVTSYLLGFVCLFWVFHGGYCALYTPTLAKAAAETDIRMYWLNPADTGWIRTLSFSFNAMSLSEGIVLTLCITGMYWFRPWESRLAATVSLTWLAVGLAGISYGFLYPQFHLYRAIRREKTRQMLRVQQQLGVLALRLMQLDDEERKQLSQLVDLNSRLSGARETAVDPKAVGGYITSLIIPTLSFLAGHFKVGSALRSLFP